MREPDLQRLETELLQFGIAPRHVRRTVCELREHMEDLSNAALDDGYAPEFAERKAAEQIGDLQEVAIAMRACPELRRWSYRFPRIAIIIYPLTCLALLPAMPVLVGVAHASVLARWTACAVLGGFVTAAILLVLQLSIALT